MIFPINWGPICIKLFLEIIFKDQKCRFRDVKSRKRHFPPLKSISKKFTTQTTPQKLGKIVVFRPFLHIKRVFSNAPKDWILLFGILNVLIPALSTTLTDLEANFIKHGHVKTCSANQFWNGCFFLCL